jgi:hypothetical protein
MLASQVFAAEKWQLGAGQIKFPIASHSCRFASEKAKGFSQFESDEQSDDSSGIALQSIPAAALLPRSPYVRVTAFRSGLFDFRICLAPNEDSCTREV